MSDDVHVLSVESISLNDHVDTYEGEATLILSNGRPLTVRFRRESEGGIEPAGSEYGPIWRWDNPEHPVEGATLSRSIGWDLDDDGSLDIHGYIRNGEWHEA